MLPLDMVEKSTSPLPIHFGPVFRVTERRVQPSTEAKTLYGRCESGLCAKTHHVYDAHQLVPPGAFFTWPWIGSAPPATSCISLLNADHGNAAKHLLDEGPLSELAMGHTEVDQHE